MTFKMITQPSSMISFEDMIPPAHRNMKFEIA